MLKRNRRSFLQTRLSLILVFLLSSSWLVAQSYAQFTLHPFNPSLLNPASASQQDELRTTILHRSQYVGMTSKALGAQVLSLDAKLPGRPFTTGLHITHDYIGLQRALGLRIDGGWRIYDKKDLSLTAGLGIGFHSLSWDGSQVITPNGLYDGSIDHQDDLLQNVMFNAQGLEWRMGIQVHYKNFSLDLGSMNFPGALRKGSDNFSVSSAPQSWIRSKYLIPLANEWYINPQVLVITDGRLLQYAFGFQVMHNKWLAGFNQRGLTSNSLEAFGANLGYRLGKNFQVVYNYEYTLSLLRGANSGSHELCLRWRRPLKYQPANWGRVYHGRYL